MGLSEKAGRAPWILLSGLNPESGQPVLESWGAIIFLDHQARVKGLEAACCFHLYFLLSQLMSHSW